MLFLFVGFRLSLLTFWPADQLSRWSDYDYYYEVASWVDRGLLPYLDYWVEYPPLFSYLSVLLYLLTSHYVAFATGLALVQLAFEVGALVLLHRLAWRTLGEARAERVVWVYALLFAPVATWWLSFDSIATFFLLLAIERWLAGRRMQSALAMGVGGLVKWFPLLFLPVIARFRRDWRHPVQCHSQKCRCRHGRSCPQIASRGYRSKPASQVQRRAPGGKCPWARRHVC